MASVARRPTLRLPKPLVMDLEDTGCGDICPSFPGKVYLDWQLDDPAGQGIDAVRPIRDDIRRRVERLLTELPVAR